MALWSVFHTGKYSCPSSHLTIVNRDFKPSAASVGEYQYLNAWKRLIVYRKSFFLTYTNRRYGYQYRSKLNFFCSAFCHWERVRKAYNFSFFLGESWGGFFATRFPVLMFVSVLKTVYKRVSSINFGATCDIETRGQFNKTFTSVIYKSVHCFSV